MDFSWKQISIKGEGTLPRSSHGLSVRGDSLIVFGGENKARVPINSDIVEIDLHTGDAKVLAIASGSTTPPHRVAHSQTLSPAPQKSLYIFGGRQGITMSERPLNDMWVFDFDKREWLEIEQTGTIPEERSFHKMICVEEKIYLFGGCGKDGRLADLHEFDIYSSTWKTLSGFSKISGRGGPGFVRSTDGKHLFVVGGFSGKEMSDVFSYNIAEDSWKEILADDKTIRPFSVSACANLQIGSGVIAFFGGEVEPSDLGHEGAGGFSNDLLLLDGNTGKPVDAKEVKVSGESPPPRGWSFADTWKENRLVVYGGLSGSDEKPIRLADLWTLTCK